jgi:hypothetical protein
VKSSIKYTPINQNAVKPIYGAQSSGNHDHSDRSGYDFSRALKSALEAEDHPEATDRNIGIYANTAATPQKGEFRKLIDLYI